MKKYLVIILGFILFPCIVFAEETCSDVNYDEYCKGSTCLASLQSEYNTWNTTGNTGVACIKVIAQINGNIKSYLTGKNPEINYKCNDGSLASAERIASAIPYEDEVTDCEDATCYVPEIWRMDCGTSTSTSNSGTSTGETSTGTSTDTGTSNSDDLSDGDDVSTNDQGQITGTTDASDTGVETYFIVLFVMIIISYGVLIISKKRNIFKSI